MGLRRVLGALSAAAWVAYGTSVGHAHGGPPSLRRVAFHPTEEDTIYAQATFGLVVSHDHGATWTLVCEEAIGWQFTENPYIVPTTDGAVVYGLLKGLHRSTDALCGASLARDDLENVPIAALDRDPTDARRVLAVTADGPRANGVYASDDDGSSWAPAGDTFEIGDVPSHLLVAPSDPMTVYVSGSRLDPALGFVARSDDGGGTWTTYEVPLEGAITFSLGAVDPRDPRRLLAFRTSFDVADALLLSEDGGETWDEVAIAAGDITAVAFAPDGSRVWYGSYEKGLHVSDDGGRTFTPQMLDLAIRCLVAREGELWVCADNYSDGFAIGLSTDGGETFEPRFVYEELAGQVACEADTRSAEVCPAVWRAIVDIFGLDAGLDAPDSGPTPSIDAGASDAGSSGDARPPAMDGARDASAPDAFVNPRAPDDGCDCSAAGSGRRGTTLLVLLLGLFLWRIRSRSKLSAS